MSESLVARYWCHMCNQMVNPIVDIELKCPNCQSGFVEEIEGREAETTPDLAPDTSLSHWAPVLLGMMGGAARHRRNNQHQTRDDEDDEDEADADTGREARVYVRRRRRHPAAVLQLLQSLRELSLESANSESDRQRERERDRQRVVLIDPFYQVVLQELLDANHNSDGSSMGPLRDLVGSSFELFLQRLAENDPNRYGTPPAQKDVVEGLPTVKVKESFSCPVCLDDLDCGAEAKEMPCKHQFHSGCIVPWLELHSSCPVCRFQLPADESKTPSTNGPRTETSTIGAGGVDADEEGSANGRRSSWLSVAWPFSGLFTSTGAPDGGGGSSASGPSSAPSGSGNYSRPNEH